jgi:peroxiredoxin Q/BCP
LPNAPLAEGVDAPEFTLPSVEGNDVSLADFRGKQVVVLYFYPKDNTPGCTQEAQDFRDDYERFKRAGAAVLGVSVDDIASHKSFAAKNKLTFPILSDKGGQVARKYGVMGWIMAKRATFVIGLDGKIVRAFPDVTVQGHAKDVLKAIVKR